MPSQTKICIYWVYWLYTKNISKTMALHWKNFIHCKVNQTILINAFIHVKIKDLCCTNNTKHFCVIFVWRASQAATRGPHSTKQSTTVIWCVTVYWFNIFVYADIISIGITFVFSHKNPRIFCLSSTIACLFTWNKMVIHFVSCHCWSSSL